jgi:hypothetical protein
VGRRCISGGVTPIGQRRIQFDFTVGGVRYRPTLPWVPHEANLRRAREHLARIKARISAGTFIFSEEFPQYRPRKSCPIPISVRTCGDVFNDFLRHEEARVAGVDRDRTKVGEDRRVKLCRRARAVLERQLALRDELAGRGRIRHEQLLFHADGRAIRRLSEVHRHWQKSLKRLAIRYRRPYTARHSSVSWNLMRRRPALYVAQQHGHRPLTMFTVYAAWTQDRPEADSRAIRRAMRASAYAARGVPGRSAGLATGNAHSGARLSRAEKLRTSPRAPSSARKRASALAMDLPVAKGGNDKLTSNFNNLHGGADGTRIGGSSPGISNLLIFLGGRPLKSPRIPGFATRFATSEAMPWRPPSRSARERGTVLT